MKRIKNFFNDESGAAAVEYGLLVAGIAVLVSAAVFTLGGTIRDLFTGVTLTAP